MDPSALEDLRRSAARVFGGEPVLFAYLHGSQATGRARPDSDVDVAVYLDDEVARDAYLETTLRLVDELSRATGLARIDVVVLNGAPPILAGRAIRGVLIYSCDEPRRVAYESLTFRMAADVEFHVAEDARAALRATAEGRGSTG